MGQQQMTKNQILWLKPALFVVALFSSQFAIAQCGDACSASLQQCKQSATAAQQARCRQQFEICSLKCNRDATQGCVWLAFENHEGVADRDKELGEITGGSFARITHEKHPHFAGLCSSYDMQCEYVLDWDRTMYSCGGDRREATRVACCR